MDLRTVRACLIASLAVTCAPAWGQAPASPGRDAAPAPAPAVPAAPAAPKAPASADGLPPIVVEPPVLDLGFMAPRVGGKGTVTLRNTGTAPLTIVAVTPSCKCTTTSSLNGTVLQPGQSVPMEAVLEGAAMPQTHRASIKVAVDGYARVLEIQLRGETAMPIRAVPSIINAVEGKPRQGRFVVESIDKKPFTICAVGGHVPEFIGYSAGDAPRAQYLVKYDLDARPEGHPAYLAIETDRADCPVFDVWVRTEATIPKSVFRMKDYRVNAGRIDSGGSTDVTLEMEDPGEEVLAIESGSPDVQLDMIGQQSDGTLRKVSVRVTPKGPRTGLVYVPFKLYGREREQQMTLFASVRRKDAAGCEGCGAPR